MCFKYIIICRKSYARASGHVLLFFRGDADTGGVLKVTGLFLNFWLDVNINFFAYNIV